MNGPVETEIARLARRLSGPRRVRRDMVAEVRDGLHDAAAAYEECGLEPAVAARRALDDFGDLDTVARELQRELEARQARRAALLVALAFLPLMLAWDLRWRLLPPDGPAPADGLRQLYLAVDLVLLTATLAAATLAPALRRAHAGPWLRRAAGIVGVATPAIVVGLSVTLMFHGAGGPGAALETPATALLALLSLSVLTASVVSGARCLRR